MGSGEQAAQAQPKYKGLLSMAALLHACWANGAVAREYSQANRYQRKRLGRREASTPPSVSLTLVCRQLRQQRQRMDSKHAAMPTGRRCPRVITYAYVLWCVPVLHNVIL